jgi:hypothetical protein
MRHRFPASIHLQGLVLIVLLLSTVPAAAQAPRTPDGRPDMQGLWTNATFTPFERPQGLAGKEFFTAEEAAAYEQKRLQEEESQPQDDLHYDNVLWQREKLAKKGLTPK